MGGRIPRPRSVAVALFLGATLVPGGAKAQQSDLRREILASQRRLEEIRSERARLEGEMEDVRIRVRDASTELANVERRLSASRSVLAEIQFQSDAVAEQVHRTTVELLQTRERMSEGKAILSRRLRDIYKTGPLHTVRVLLGASSFTDLLNRYRYLQKVALFDRRLVESIGEMEAELAEQSRELQQRLAELGSLRHTRLGEVAQLRAIEAERQTALADYRSREQRTLTRLEQLEADEGRMTGLIADLERRRLEEERRLSAEAAAGRASSSPGAGLSEADAGSLDWPVSGEVIYQFGRDRRPNGLVLRWNGVGIAAPTGSPVRAVRAGRVVLAGPFEGYGPTVVLSHGNGIYTLYLYLEEIGVVQGRDVASGQVVGTVGGADTPEGPHLEFQIRAPLEGGTPQAQDPLRWLKPREGM